MPELALKETKKKEKSSSDDVKALKTVVMGENSAASEPAEKAGETMLKMDAAEKAAEEQAQQQLALEARSRSQSQSNVFDSWFDKKIDKVKELAGNKISEAEDMANNIGWSSSEEEKKGGEKDSGLAAMATEKATEKATKIVKEMKDATIKNKDLNAGIDVVKKTGKDAVERLATVKDNAIEAASNIKEAPSLLKDALYGKYSEEDVKNMVNDFLGVKEEKKKDKKDKNVLQGDHNVTLAEFMLLPGLTFEAGFGAKWDLEPYAKLNAENLLSLVKEDNPNFNVSLEAGIKAQLSLSLSAGLSTGIPFLIKGYAGLNAKAGLKGAALKGSKGRARGEVKGDNVALYGSLDIPLAFDKKKMRIKQGDDVKLNVGGGLNLKGSVGGEAYLQSKLLSWKKTLFEKKFAEWDLATINFNFGASKKKPADGEQMGFFEGWEFDSADFQLSGPDSGLGKAFCENNNASNSYSISTADMSPSEEYGDLQNDFEAALKLLEEFSRPQKARTLVVPKDPKESGASGTVSNLKKQVENNFVAIWAGAQNELIDAKQALEAYMKDDISHKKKEEKAMKEAEKHGRALGRLESWKIKENAQKGNAKGNAAKADKDKNKAGELLKNYNKEAKNGGHGFKRYMKSRAKDEAYSFDSLVRYEQKRYVEKTKKHTYRISELLRLMNSNKKDKEIIEYYKENLKGKAAFKHKSAVQTVGKLKEFEEKKIREYQDIAIKHANATNALMEKFSYNKKGKKEIDRAKFFKKYADTVPVSSALYYYGSKDYLLEYEKSRLRAKGKDNAKHYIDLLERKEQPEGTGKKKNDNKDEKIKKEDEKIKKDYYLTATAEELKEYEEQINKGEFGTTLSLYMDYNEKLKEDEGKQKNEKSKAEKPKTELGSIFGKNKSKALKAFKKRLRSRSVDENISYISLDMLYEYIRKRIKNTSSQELQKQLSEELSYVRNEQYRLINIVDEKKRKEKEAELVKNYFNRFTASAAEYQHDLETGNEVNLDLMQAAFREDSNNARMKVLNKMTKEGEKEPDYLIIREYLKADGVDKDKLTEFLLKKRGKDALSPENKKKFYAAAMAGEKESEKYLNRLEKIMEASQTGDYAAVLDAYEKLGAGKGYAQQIKKELATGKVGGRVIDIDEVVKYETLQINLAGAMHADMMKLFDGMSDDQMLGNGKLMDEYKKKSIANEARQKGLSSIIGTVKDTASSMGIDVDTQFEKSLKDVDLTPQQLLSYERLRKEEEGRKHKERIKSLLGVETLTDEQIENDQLPNPEKIEEQEERRKAYINNAGRFAKDEDIKKRETESMERMMGNEDILYEEMVKYETQRKEHYEDRFMSLRGVHDKLVKQINTLEKEVAISSNIVYNLNDIEKKPEIIFDKIKDFREAVGIVKAQPKEENDMQKEQEELVKEAKVQMEQADMDMMDDSEEDA